MAKLSNKLLLFATVTLVAGVGLLMVELGRSRQQAFFQSNPEELVDEVWHIIDNDYVDQTYNQVDWQQVRREYLEREYSDPQQAYKAIRTMLEKLGDPYTRFMDPDEYKNMQIDTSGELTGVGLQLTQDEKTKELVVVSPIEDTPAYTAGIRSRDVIIAIDGADARTMDMEAAVKLIRGPVNSKVTLTVRRDRQELTFNLIRKRIEIHPVRYSFRQEGSTALGYIRLNQFNANATTEMRSAIQSLEQRNVKGYILDLRSNPGGLLYSSIDIARMWIPKGVIVSTVDRRGTGDRQQADNRALTTKPLVVLVDGGSASASEILSGALQDHKRAVLVGTKTFGKGLVQSVRPLGDGSGLAVTIAKYLTPNGRDINKHGIEPDVTLELDKAQLEALSQNRDQIGTLADPQYAKALDELNRVLVTQTTSPKTPAQKS